MRTKNSSKEALDKIIRKSRVLMYKPIQIAEILFHHRTERRAGVNDLERYRNISKRWRDELSSHLVGHVCTSSQKFQDNLFEENAMPPRLLKQLAVVNKAGAGFVEAYIYKSLAARLSSVRGVERYISTSTADSFSLMKLVSIFQKTPGLKRSVDKMYEILVYALFATIVRALKAQVILEIGNKDRDILKDFEKFIKMVLGIDAKNTQLISPAALYRVGVTNAADRGLDMWANFGPAIQVKHLTLTADHVEGIAGNISADRIVIVCLDIERKSIESLLEQVGWSQRIQGIITINDLDEWYKLCLSKKYRKNLGVNLLKDVECEFGAEFPSSKNIDPFMRKREYDKLAFPKGWEI